MKLLDIDLYNQGSLKTPFEWYRMVDTVRSQIEMRRGRLLISELSATPPVQYIRSIIDRINTETYLLDEDTDMLDVYTDNVRRMSLNIEHSIDPIVIGPSNRSWFVQGNQIDEIIIPTTGLLTANYYELVEDWDDWEDIVPLRIMDHDSSELPMEFVNGQISFKRDVPTYMVIAIDVAALLMKYIGYVREEGSRFDIVDKDEFVTKYILPAFYDQLLEVWVLNWIDSHLQNVVLGNITEVTLPIVNTAYVSESSILRASQSIGRMVQDVQKNRNALGGFLHTKLFGNRSIADVMDNHRNIYQVSQGNKYIGYSIGKSATLLGILAQLIQLQVTIAATTNLQRDLRVQLQHIDRSGWKSHIRDSVLKDRVRELVVLLSTLI